MITVRVDRQAQIFVFCLRSSEVYNSSIHTYHTLQPVVLLLAVAVLCTASGKSPAVHTAEAAAAVSESRFFISHFSTRTAAQQLVTLPRSAQLDAV